MTLGCAIRGVPPLGHGASRHGGPVVPVLLLAPVGRLAVDAEAALLARRAVAVHAADGPALGADGGRGPAVVGHAFSPAGWVEQPHQYTRPAASRQGSVKGLDFFSQAVYSLHIIL